MEGVRVAEDEQGAVRAFLAGIRVGEVLGGVVAEVTSRGVAVVLDGFPSRPLGAVGELDLTWGPGRRRTWWWGGGSRVR